MSKSQRPNRLIVPINIIYSDYILIDSNFFSSFVEICYGKLDYVKTNAAKLIVI